MAHSHYDPAALLANVKFLSDSLILKVLLIVLVIVLLYLLRKAINDGKKVAYGLIYLWQHKMQRQELTDEAIENIGSAIETAKKLSTLKTLILINKIRLPFYCFC